jgi:ATP-dependent DNA ligase
MTDERLNDFVSKLDVMKPASINKDNAKHLIKLDTLYDSPDYVIEDKLDGCHYLMIACRFFSTEHNEKTDNFPLQRDFFVSLGMPNLILDGEMYYPGKTSQYCTRVTGAGSETAVSFQNKNGPIHYVIWDMLRTPKGTWLVNYTLQKRRQLLEYFYDNHIKGTGLEKYIHLTKQHSENKRQFRDAIIELGGEGVVLKNINSLYIMGKKPMWMWVKDKIHDETDFFIIGYMPPTVIYEGASENWPYWLDINGVSSPVTKYHYHGWIGALCLGAMVNGVATQITTCSGLDEKTRKEISEDPNKYLNRVVKVTYMQKTEAGIPRHPRFEEFHESKSAEECIWNYDD